MRRVMPVSISVSKDVLTKHDRFFFFSIFKTETRD